MHTNSITSKYLHTYTHRYAHTITHTYSMYTLAYILSTISYLHPPLSRRVSQALARERRVCVWIPT